MRAATEVEGRSGAEFFYVRDDFGVTVLEVPRFGRPNVEVHLYSLGRLPYTYVGRCH